MNRNKNYHKETSPVVPMTFEQSELYAQLQCPKITLEEAHAICKEFGKDARSQKYIEDIFSDSLKKASLKETSPLGLRKLYDAVPESKLDVKPVIAERISKNVLKSYKKATTPLALKQLFISCPKEDCQATRQLIIDQWDKLFFEKVQGGLSIQKICKSPELVTIVLFSPIGTKCLDQIKAYFNVVFEKVKEHHPKYFSDNEKYICPRQ